MLKKLMFISLFFLVIGSAISAEKYAVIITGDDTTKKVDSTDDKTMFAWWHDTVLMWDMLVRKQDFDPDKVYFLYAGGLDFPIWNGGANTPFQYWMDTYPEYGFSYQPSDFKQLAYSSATRENIESLFDSLSTNNVMTEDDFLFVATLTHGGYEGEDTNEGLILIWDDDPNSYPTMSDNDFADMIEKVPANKKVFWLGQCSSGNFVDDLESMNDNSHKIVNAACLETESTRPCDDAAWPGQINTWQGVGIEMEHLFPDDPYFNIWHDEYFFHVYTSTTGIRPFAFDDVRPEIAAHPYEYQRPSETADFEWFNILDETDINSDGIVSIVESEQWYAEYNTWIRPGSSQTSVFSDLDNIGISTSLLYPTIILNNYCEYINTIKGIMAIPLDLPVTGENLILPPNSHTTLFENKHVNIKSGYTLKIENEATLKMLANTEIIVETGGNLLLNSNASIEVFEDSKITVQSGGTLIADGATFRYTSTEGGQWLGINGQSGSAINLKNVTISGAATGISADTPAIFKVTNSTFEGCTNGIDLVGMEGLDYSIIDNTLTGIEDGRGITITSADGIFSRNKISRFNTGASFIMSSPDVSKCEFSYNKYYGILSSGQEALPHLINTEQIQIKGELNCLLEKNGYASNTSLFQSAQIGIIPVGSIYMRNNDIISSPNYPGISIAQAAFINPQHILVDAQYNYWGAGQITDDYFFGHADYTIDYEPYYSAPCGTGAGSDPSLAQYESTESRMLIKAINLEYSGKIIAAIKLFEQIIKKYVDTPEYYVAMARLPYLYDKAGLDNNELITLFDEALKSDKVSHKKFFKGKKVATHIKGKRYDEAIAIAEEMKEEADFEEEIILADINIAIANMLKDSEGKGKSGTQINVRELISKLYGDEEKNEPSDITESSFPSQHVLFQNYPNPFNPVTQIKFALAKTADVKLSVYNITGQLVSQLANGTMNAGVHTVDLDGSRLNSGIYYYMLEVDGNAMTRRMVLMK